MGWQVQGQENNPLELPTAFDAHFFRWPLPVEVHTFHLVQHLHTLGRQTHSMREVSVLPPFRLDSISHTVCIYILCWGMREMEPRFLRRECEQKLLNMSLSLENKARSWQPPSYASVTSNIALSCTDLYTAELKKVHQSYPISYEKWGPAN